MCKGRHGPVQRKAQSSAQLIMAYGRFEMLHQGGDTAPFLPPLTHCASNHGRALNSICTADNGIWQQFKGIYSKVIEQAHCWRRQARIQNAPLSSLSLLRLQRQVLHHGQPVLLLFQWHEDQGGNQEGTTTKNSNT